MLDSYSAFFERYRGADREGAIREMLTLSGATVDEAVTLLEEARWPTLDLEAAALLHVEAAIDPHVNQSGEQVQVAAAWRIADFDHGTRLPTRFQSQLFLLVAWQLQAELRLEDRARHPTKFLDGQPNHRLICDPHWPDVAVLARTQGQEPLASSAGMDNDGSKRKRLQRSVVRSCSPPAWTKLKFDWLAISPNWIELRMPYRS